MSEIYMDEIYFFSNSPFVGRSINRYQLLHTTELYNECRRYLCQAYSSSNRVIGKGKLPFRVCARFSFIRKGEKPYLENLEAVEPDLSNIGNMEAKHKTMRMIFLSQRICLITKMNESTIQRWKLRS